MGTIIDFLKYLLVNHGIWALFGFMILITISLGIFGYIIFSWTDSGKALDRKLADKIELEKAAHKVGNKLRKQFSENVEILLQELAEKTNADRALVFEYSNGTSNLVGLPFLFASASAEITTVGTPIVSHLYQRMNIAIVANFLYKLEKDGYIFIEDFEQIKDTYPIVYNLMTPNRVKSALFYAIQGVDEIVGFIVITTINQKILSWKESLHEIAKAAQLISAMWNFDDLTKYVKNDKKNKCLWKMNWPSNT